jgi:uncharacterized DUF497 family protein
MEFRWNDWNIEHIAKHGVSREEAEFVVNRARRPYPKKQGQKWFVAGRGRGGRLVRVVYVLDIDGTAFVVHAMPLTDREKRRHRRRRR